MDKVLVSLGIAGIALSAASASAATIAYDNVNLGQGNQNFGNSLGLDFDVNSPITVTALGAYDTGNPAQLVGQDGMSGVTVAIFNTTTETQIGPSVTFTPTNAGMQINADAFSSVTPYVLSPGSYSIVAFNDNNYNSGCCTNGTSTENSGGGAISFVGGGRYGGDTINYPTQPDGGPSNRYDAGTFQFTVPEPASIGMLSIAAVGLMARRRRI